MADLENSGYASQGASSIAIARKRIIAGYKFAQDMSSIRPVRTEHGNTGELLLREWLKTFLPSKYGVTSGFIISTYYNSDKKIKHYDLIIYDKINSPVLWYDDSAGERRLALPVEHVFAVFEVKSKFNAKSTKVAIDKLKELDELRINHDKPDQMYKKFLPNQFFSGVIFFEYDRAALYSKTSMNNLNWPNNQRFVGLILDADHDDSSKSTYIGLQCGEDILVTSVGRGKEAINSGFVYSDSVLHDNRQHSVSFNTGLNVFSKFSFDLLAMLDGTYRVGYSSSEYGLIYGAQQ